jgi:hypothetical protein
VLDYQEVEQMLEQARVRRASKAEATEDTIEDYLLIYMISSGYKEEGGVSKDKFLRFYQVA